MNTYIHNLLSTLSFNDFLVRVTKVPGLDLNLLYSLQFGYSCSACWITRIRGPRQGFPYSNYPRTRSCKIALASFKLVAFLLPRPPKWEIKSRICLQLSGCNVSTSVCVVQALYSVCGFIGFTFVLKNKQLFSHLLKGTCYSCHFWGFLSFGSVSLPWGVTVPITLPVELQ